MNWITSYFSSSIGRKVIMSLTGLFLIVFLVVHLLGNLQLLKDDGGEAFNIYAHFMTTNPLVKFLSYGLYFFILLHAFLGISLWLKNKQAKGTGYAVSNTKTTTAASRNMAWLGIIIFAFLVIHLAQFWAKMKFGTVEMVTYDGQSVKDLYSLVNFTFEQPLYVGIYIVSMIVIGMHLWHGFQSTFQSLGLRHQKYTPLIEKLGMLYSIVIPALYAIIPILMYLNN